MGAEIKRRGLDKQIRSPRPTQTTTNPAYERFKERYRNRPWLFVKECFDWSRVKHTDGPAMYQLQVLYALVVFYRICVRGPHGLGKTAMSSWIVLWFALTRDGENWQILTTAGAWRQLTNYLWPEIHKWSRFLRWDIIGREPFDLRRELLAHKLELSTGRADAGASNDPGKVEGLHADQVLVLFDESKSIGDGMFDALEGAFSGAGPETGREAFAVAFSTPGPPSGRFFEIFGKRDAYKEWWPRHVKIEEVVAAGRISPSWVEARKGQWGEKSAIYRNRVLGEFATSDQNSVIPLEWIEKANERWLEFMDQFPERKRNARGLVEAGYDLKRIGADIAWEGEDKSAFALLHTESIISEVRQYAKEDPTVISGRLQLLADTMSPLVEIAVDVIGIGAGVWSNLWHAGYTALRFNSSRNKGLGRDALQEFTFGNQRAQAWWYLREMLDPQNGFDIMLPPDDDLIGDLSAPTFRTLAGSKLYIEEKSEIKKRLKRRRSPDKGDAVVMSFWTQPKSEHQEHTQTTDVPASAGISYAEQLQVLANSTPGANARNGQVPL